MNQTTFIFLLLFSRQLIPFFSETDRQNWANYESSWTPFGRDVSWTERCFCRELQAWHVRFRMTCNRSAKFGLCSPQRFLSCRARHCKWLRTSKQASTAVYTPGNCMVFRGKTLWMLEHLLKYFFQQSLTLWQTSVSLYEWIPILQTLSCVPKSLSDSKLSCMKYRNYSEISWFRNFLQHRDGQMVPPPKTPTRLDPFSPGWSPPSQTPRMALTWPVRVMKCFLSPNSESAQPY